jgi:hypothetical protein
VLCFSLGKAELGKTKVESKTDVIPNRAERPVRACPELAEGSLFSHHQSQAHSSEKEIQD